MALIKINLDIMWIFLFLFYAEVYCNHLSPSRINNRMYTLEMQWKASPAWHSLYLYCRDIALIDFNLFIAPYTRNFSKMQNLLP